MTSRYSASTRVELSFARLCADHNCSRSRRSEPCPSPSSAANARFTGPKYVLKYSTTSEGGNGYSIGQICFAVCKSATPSRNRSRTVAASPHWIGGGTPGGGGTCLATV